MNQSYKVSVIIPVYNSGIYLKPAINSVLSQSFRDFEIILVDDGSLDGSSELCDEFAKIDPRIKVIHQVNGGICNARNTALKVAKGEYIAFCDHDDEYSPELLSKAYNKASTDGADFVKFCKKEIVIIDGQIVRTKCTSLENKTFNQEAIRENVFNFLNGRILECVWDGLFRREFLNKNSIKFNESYKQGGEDVDILLKIVKKAKTMSTIDSVLYNHYIRQNFSTSSKFSTSKLGICIMFGKNISECLEEMNVDLDKHKSQFVHQMMFAMFNSSANLLANPKCKLRYKEKKEHLIKLTKEKFIPSWFFKQSVFSLFKVDKKISLSYLLLKHHCYFLYLTMFKFRQIHLKTKATHSKHTL